MKKKLIMIVTVCVLLLFCVSFGVIAYATDNSAKEIPNEPATQEFIDEDQILHEKLAAEKEAMLADYVPQESVEFDYFSMAAEKLGVDISGLSYEEIVNAVKAAEEAMQQAYDPSNDVDLDEMIRAKEAMLQ